MDLQGELVRLSSVAEHHVPELRRILRTPEVFARWGDEGSSENWPFDDPEAVKFAVLEDDAVVGMIQYGEESDPMYRHASIDVFLDPAVHGRGVGRDSVRTIARYLLHDLGHHRLVIDPAADNAAAIACYAAVGFQRVGVMRGYERDAGGDDFHDGLLMDLLAGELR